MVLKPNNQVCTSVDLTHLNENVQKNRHPLPRSGRPSTYPACRNPELDANLGFWQTPCPPSLHVLLTTFITLFGHYRFQRVHSAPEHFQWHTGEIIDRIPGVVMCLMNDLLVHGRSQKEHDWTLYYTRKTQRCGCYSQQREMKVLSIIRTIESVDSELVCDWCRWLNLLSNMRRSIGVTLDRMFLV